MSNYDVVCEYVFERVFARSQDFNRVTRGAVLGLVMMQAMAETMAMPKMPAIARNRTYVDKYMAHADNLVTNQQEFFKIWPPAWLTTNCFTHTDLAMKSKIKLDTAKHLDNQWVKAKQILAEIRKDYMPIYAQLFNCGIPSGNQLKELLDKFRKAICGVHKARKAKSVPMESDEFKDDDPQETKEAEEEEEEGKEDEAKEEEEELVEGEEESEEDAAYFPSVLVVFLLLGPFSPEPISFATLGTEEMPEANPVSGGAGAVNLSSEKLKNDGANSRARSIRGISPTEREELFKDTKKRSLDAIEESNRVGQRLATTMERQSAIANMRTRIEIAQMRNKPTEEIDMLYDELELLLTSTSTSTSVYYTP